MRMLVGGRFPKSHSSAREGGMALVNVSLATVLLLIAATGCGAAAAGNPSDPDRQTCETDGRAAVSTYSQSVTLAAALPTTAGAATQWEYTRFGPNGPRPATSRWSSLPAGQRVLFCYFDGEFVNYYPPGEPRPLIHERALVIVASGWPPVLDHIGSKASTPLNAP